MTRNSYKTIVQFDEMISHKINAHEEPIYFFLSGHSTHFQVGGDNSKVEGGILQNQHAKQSSILLSL